jgi:2,5-diketo-D-gluconate reductase A
LATKYNVTPAQLLLKWALQHGYAVLPKSNSHDRIISNIDIVNKDFMINDEDMMSLDSLDQNKSFAWPIGDPCLHP